MLSPVFARWTSQATHATHNVSTGISRVSHAQGFVFWGVSSENERFCVAISGHLLYQNFPSIWPEFFSGKLLSNFSQQDEGFSIQQHSTLNKLLKDS